MLAELLLKWPLIRQLAGDKDAAVSENTRDLLKKNDSASVARSICPYCGVGCGQLVYHRDNRVVSIEGDPESPISRGHLCPKGALDSLGERLRPDPRQPRDRRRIRPPFTSRSVLSKKVLPESSLTTTEYPEPADAWNRTPVGETTSAFLSSSSQLQGCGFARATESACR